MRKLDGVEVAAGCLEELWVSYNCLDRLAGAERLPRLRVLLAGSNRVGAWAEVERLAGLTGLQELLLAGNPLATEAGAEWRVEVLRRLPRLLKLDGVAVEAGEREAAKAAGGVGGAAGA